MVLSLLVDSGGGRGCWCAPGQDVLNQAEREGSSLGLCLCREVGLRGRKQLPLLRCSWPQVRQHWGRFWFLVNSTEMGFLCACFFSPGVGTLGEISGVNVNLNLNVILTLKMGDWKDQYLAITARAH